MHRFHYLHLHAHARKQVTQKSCVVLHAPEPTSGVSSIHQLLKKCEVAISYVGGRKASVTPAGVERIVIIRGMVSALHSYLHINTTGKLYGEMS